jgi:tetratricopeptide (TPR) repeat protein
VDGSPGRIKQAIDRHEPPIIMVRIKDDLYHFFVVSGYSDRLHMILCEEYDGAKRAIAFNELRELWSPTNFFMLEISPSTAESDFELGAKFESEGKYPEAIQMYEKALARDPAHQPSMVGMGNCNLALGERVKAIECYRRALSLYPDDPKALNNLAHTLWASGQNLDEAKTLSDRAVKIYVDRLSSLEKILVTMQGQGAAEETQKDVIRRRNETRIELALGYGTLAAVRFALDEFALAISAWKASYDMLDLSFTDLRARRLLMIARSYKHLNVRSQWEAYLDEAARTAQDPNLIEEIRTERLGEPKSE